MSVYVFNLNTVSDIHEAAYGFRPDSNFWNHWETLDEEDKLCKQASMLDTLFYDESGIYDELEQRLDQEQAVVVVERAINAYDISDRNKAIRFFIKEHVWSAPNGPDICKYLNLPMEMASMFDDALMAAR